MLKASIFNGSKEISSFKGNKDNIAKIVNSFDKDKFTEIVVSFDEFKGRELRISTDVVDDKFDINEDIASFAKSIIKEKNIKNVSKFDVENISFIKDMSNDLLDTYINSSSEKDILKNIEKYNLIIDSTIEQLNKIKQNMKDICCKHNCSESICKEKLEQNEKRISKQQNKSTTNVEISE